MRLLFLTVFIFLGGCGFKPRGYFDFPKTFQNVYIESKEPYGDLEKNIKIYLKSFHVNTKENINDADIILKISESTSEYLLNRMVDKNIIILQHKLSLSIDFEILNKKNSITGIQKISRYKIITINENSVLSDSNKKNFAYQNMRQQIIDDIFYRISSYEINNKLSHSSCKNAAANCSIS